MQPSFFSSEVTQLDLPEADVRYIETFVNNHQQYFETLKNEILWRTDTIRIAGKMIPIPRLNAWYGDDDAHYSYSGIFLKPLPWTQALLQLKAHVEGFLDTGFNSVLINYYRDGNDSVAWHSDFAIVVLHCLREYSYD